MSSSLPEERSHRGSEEENYGSASVPPDFVHEETFNDFYCGGTFRPADIHIGIMLHSCVEAEHS